MATKARTCINAKRCMPWYVSVANRRLPKLCCRPTNGMLDSKGPLSGTIAPNILAKVNGEVKLATAGQEKKKHDRISPSYTRRSSRAVSMEFEQLCNSLAKIQ